jgi:hypothetical protein
MQLANRAALPVITSGAGRIEIMWNGVPLSTGCKTDQSAGWVDPPRARALWLTARDPSGCPGNGPAPPRARGPVARGPMGDGRPAGTHMSRRLSRVAVNYAGGRLGAARSGPPRSPNAAAINFLEIEGAGPPLRVAPAAAAGEEHDMVPTSQRRPGGDGMRAVVSGQPVVHGTTGAASRRPQELIAASSAARRWAEAHGERFSHGRRALSRALWRGSASFGRTSVGPARPFPPGKGSQVSGLASGTCPASCRRPSPAPVASRTGVDAERRPARGRRRVCDRRSAAVRPGRGTVIGDSTFRRNSIA